MFFADRGLRLAAVENVNEGLVPTKRRRHPVVGGDGINIMAMASVGGCGVDCRRGRGVRGMFEGQALCG